MTSHLRAQQATIRTIDTNFLNINQELTSVKWNPAKRHPDIFLLNSTETAKLVDGKSGAKAILGNVSYTIGTDTDSIKYCVHQGSVIHVGFATSARDLSSLAPSTDLISEKYDITHDTFMTLSLGLTMLTITYGNVKRVVDITGYTGLVMSPWLSDDTNGTGFSVSIAKVSALQSFVRENGDIVFTSIDEGGVSRPIRFETGSQSVIFDNLGFSGLPSIQFDILESATSAPFTMQLRVQGAVPSIKIDELAHLEADGGLEAPFLESSSGPLILREISGASVTIDTFGNVVSPGSVTALSMVSNSLSSTLGNNLTLFENSGLGLTVTDVTGEVIASGKLKVGSGAVANTPASVASFSSAAGNMAIILPSVTNTLISPAIGFTFVSANLVPGMIVFNTSTAQFEGWNGSAFVVLG